MSNIKNLNENKVKIRRLPRKIGVEESLQDAIEREELEGKDKSGDIMKSRKCACGCGQPVKEGRKYVKSGHSMRGRHHSFETRLQMSKSSPKYWLGKKGKNRLSAEQKRKQAESISLSLRGKPKKFDILAKLRRAEASARREGLGFIPLNTPFRGCVRHNIDHNAVIFMDASVHAHYKHSLKNPGSMDIINSIAISYMDSEEDYELLIDSMLCWE